MSSMRGVLVDVVVSLLILILAGSIFSRLAGVEEGETAPAWVQFGPLVLAMLYLGWRTLKRNRQRRDAEANAEAEETDAPFENHRELERVESPPMDDYQWRSRLESSVRYLGRDAFEQYTRRILRAMEVVDVNVARIAFDGAVECIGVQDDEERASVYVICRRTFGALGANQVRELRTLMEGQATVGLFITNGEFASAAIDEADEGDEPIELVDGDELLDLMHTHRLGLIFDEIGRVIAIDDEWFQDLEREHRFSDGD